MSLTISRPDLTLTLQILRPFRHQYIGCDKRHIYEFWKLNCPASRGEGAMRDPSVARQMAIIWARDGDETFTLQYYPSNEAAQIIANLPLSELNQAVSDLRAAGF